MKQSLHSKASSGTQPGGSLSRRAPAEEPPRAGIIRFDKKTGRHLSDDPDHQAVLDLFDRWREIPEGTFSTARELAVLSAFGVTEVDERIREYSSDVCPAYGVRLNMFDYSGRVREIMRHTQSIHLNRSGLDHFGVPIFDLELLRHEGAEKAIADIDASVLSALSRRGGRDSDAKCGYYIFQGLRMLRYMERFGARHDWDELSGRFPKTPVPVSFDFENDLAETEKLETRAFRSYINKRTSGLFPGY